MRAQTMIPAARRSTASWALQRRQSGRRGVQEPRKPRRCRLESVVTDGRCACHTAQARPPLLPGCPSSCCSGIEGDFFSHIPDDDKAAKMYKKLLKDRLE